VSKEFKVGLIAVVSIIILYVGFNFLKGVDFFSPTNSYYIMYDNINGLTVSNPVIVNGYSVGRVSRIRILQDRGNIILVKIDVDEDLILGESTKATLVNNDFLGGKAIILDINSIDSPLESGDTLISVVDRGLLEILDQAQPLTDNITTTIKRVNEILLGLDGIGEKFNKTADQLNGTLAGVNRLVNKNEEQISETIIQFKLMSEEINLKLKQLDPIIQKSTGTLDKINALQLEETLANLNGVMVNLNTTLEAINNTDGTIGKAMADDALYNNLNQAILDLSDLATHFNTYPKHFLGPLGKSNKKIERDLKKTEN
jgi:phospholipid/cholesterol/gamma-HCH transport system substrate-binding protein